MKTRLAATLLGLAPVLAHAACLPVSGTVQLTPDPACQVQAQVPGVYFTGQCFSVTLSMLGIPTGRGYAGVSSEAVAGADGQVTVTPVVIPEDSDTSVPRQIVQTARSAIGVGWGPFRTVLYSSDVTVIRPSFSPAGEVIGDVVTEQILITGTDGRGLFANTTGHLVVLGNSIGQSARVVGELCSQ